jgi:hypothetical protein
MHAAQAPLEPTLLARALLQAPIAMALLSEDEAVVGVNGASAACCPAPPAPWSSGPGTTWWNPPLCRQGRRPQRRVRRLNFLA